MTSKLLKNNIVIHVKCKKKTKRRKYILVYIFIYFPRPTAKLISFCVYCTDIVFSNTILNDWLVLDSKEV